VRLAAADLLRDTALPPSVPLDESGRRACLGERVQVLPVPVLGGQMLGHATVAFTMDVYTEVAEELYEAAAEAIAAFIPRRRQPGN